MNTILTDVVPPKARKYVYAALTLGAVVYGAYQTANGDWGQVAVSVLGTLFGATAASNTDVSSGE